MNKIKYFSLYIPLTILIGIYISHGIEGLEGSEEFRSIIGVIGFSTFINTLLVFLVGLLDSAVAVLLVTKDKILPKFSHIYLFLWAGIWPWIPRVLEWYGGLHVEVGYPLFITITAIIAYYIHKNNKNTYTTNHS